MDRVEGLSKKVGEEQLGAVEEVESESESESEYRYGSDSHIGGSRKVLTAMDSETLLKAAK